MLELEGVAKSYAGHAALQRTNLTIEQGCTTVLIGPSGCGKSTLLRLMVGLIRADRGTVRFEGTPLAASNLLEIRRRIGYVVQEGGLFPHLTARDNILLMARHSGWPKTRISGRLEELAELVQLRLPLLRRFPVQLSGGQRQRVSLMRALMLDPDVLLLDEPLVGLDPIIRSELQADLRQIFRKLGKTVVIVTHDIGEAAYFGDTIILLRGGKILQQGSIRDLIDTPADLFVARFISAQRSSLEGLRGSSG